MNIKTFANKNKNQIIKLENQDQTLFVGPFMVVSTSDEKTISKFDEVITYQNELMNERIDSNLKKVLNSEYEACLNFSKENDKIEDLFFFDNTLLNVIPKRELENPEVSFNEDLKAVKFKLAKSDLFILGKRGA